MAEGFLRPIVPSGNVQLLRSSNGLTPKSGQVLVSHNFLLLLAGGGH